MLFNVLVPCRLTDLVVWGSQRSFIDIQKAFVPSGFLSVVERSWSSTCFVCWGGRMELYM